MNELTLNSISKIISIVQYIFNKTMKSLRRWTMLEENSKSISLKQLKRFIARIHLHQESCLVEMDSLLHESLT